MELKDIVSGLWDWLTWRRTYWVMQTIMILWNSCN